MCHPQASKSVLTKPWITDQYSLLLHKINTNVLRIVKAPPAPRRIWTLIMNIKKFLLYISTEFL